MGTVAISLQLALQLLPYAVQAFGAGATEVRELVSATGLNDTQLLDEATKINASTREMIVAHIAAVTADQKAAQAAG